MSRKATRKLYSRRLVKGVSLLEVMIVFAATMVFVAVTAPLSSDLNVRLRVAEGLSIVDSAQRALQESCQKDGHAIINSNHDAGFDYVPAGSEEDYVNSIALSANCAENNMFIVVWTTHTGAEQDPVIELSSNERNEAGEPTWNCRVIEGNLQHVPAVCRKSDRPMVASI